MNALGFVMAYLDWVLLTVGVGVAFWLLWVKEW